MKECLHCKEKFQEKRDTAKFCSTSCRVMYSRKNKKPKISEAVIENEIFGALAEMKETRKQMASDLLMFGQARTDGKPLTELRPDTPFSIIPVNIDEPLSFDKIKKELIVDTSLPTFEQLQIRAAKLVFSDEKTDMMVEIMEYKHITDQQKDKLFQQLKQW